MNNEGEQSYCLKKVHRAELDSSYSSLEYPNLVSTSISLIAGKRYICLLLCHLKAGFLGYSECVLEADFYPHDG